MPTVEGMYTHYADHEATGFVERFVCMTTGATTETLTLSLEQDGALQLTATVFIEQSVIRGFSFMRPAMPNAVSGSYLHRGKWLQVERLMGTNATVTETIPFTQDGVLDLPFLSCKGFALMQLRGRTDVPTFAPLLTVADRAGDLAKKTARFVDSLDTIQIMGCACDAVRVRHGYTYWLTNDGWVLRSQSEADGVQYTADLTRMTVI